MPGAVPLIITVHGTFAGSPDDWGENWWQLGSRLHEQLLGQLGGGHEVEPFHWGVGPNLESARRLAGHRLLKRMLELERDARPYHMVGHSHGGSVIWHALVEAARRGQTLPRMRSWTTVGTPFLVFRPSRVSRAFCVASLTLLGMVAALTHAMRDMPSALPAMWREGEWGAAVLPVALAVFLAGLVVVSARAATRPIRHFMGRAREERAWSAAARAFGGRWLGLWHEADEPTSGLAATLGEIPRIIPRSRPTGLKALLLAPLAWVHDRLTARAADQFVWSRLTGRLQGGDLPGLGLASVGRAPPHLRPQQRLPEEAARDMARMADEGAAKTIANMRSLIGLAYETRGMGATLAGARQHVSWAAIIHTSYFDAPAVVAAISERIRSPLTAPDPVSDALPPLAVPAAASDAAPELRVIASLGFAAAGGLLAVAATTSHVAFVEPYTDRHQVAEIARNAAGRNLINSHGSPYPGDVLVRLAALSSLDAPVEIWLGARDPSTFHMATFLLARFYGRKGRVDVLSAVEARLRGLPQRDPRAGMLPHFLTYGLLGLAEGGHRDRVTPDAVRALPAADDNAAGDLRLIQALALHIAGRARDAEAWSSLAWDRLQGGERCPPEHVADVAGRFGKREWVEWASGACREGGNASLLLAAAAGAAAAGRRDDAADYLRRVPVGAARGTRVDNAQVVGLMLRLGMGEEAESRLLAQLDAGALYAEDAVASARLLVASGRRAAVEANLDRIVERRVERAGIMLLLGVGVLQVTEDVVPLLVAVGRRDLALKAAEDAARAARHLARTPDAETRQDAFARAAGVAADAGNLALARSLFLDAVSRSDRSARERDRFQGQLALAALSMRIAPEMTRGLIEAAVSAANAHDEFMERSRRIAQVARLWASLGDTRRARLTAELAQDPARVAEGYAATLDVALVGAGASVPGHDIGAVAVIQREVDEALDRVRMLRLAFPGSACSLEELDEGTRASLASVAGNICRAAWEAPSAPPGPSGGGATGAASTQ